MMTTLINRKLFTFLTLIFSILLNSSSAHAKPKTIHVFVALADNKSQGIVPVPAKIGNGDDPENNLYWGCDEGLKSFFRHSPDWKLIESRMNPVPASPAILERCIFKHATQDAFLIADAYRGREIKQAITDLLSASVGNHPETIPVTIDQKTVELSIKGGASLIAYIGHDGLMDFECPEIPPNAGKPTAAPGKPAIVLCCLSEQYFLEPLRRCGANPLLLTTQLMYPGSFILKSVVDGWLLGETADQLRERAARVYAKNQNISRKAARGVFCVPTD